ncbi:hypothetical protein N1M2_93 [Klebsiella phage N1M2]|uniref:Uncharacterized protein n=1 Tax=Klebsiella phage N1M2 TaxID=2664939 RepID=A0A6B7ZEQ7_9CAUD|nr:hypothetical protein PQB72_gp093 [Klebsiella phage N1M2]QGH71956.1 hypothetical protein N1M2_93 [Klebsiella phage N1M2]
MELERYTFLRNELRKMYTILTEQTFIVSIPLSSFMTLKQLDRAKNNPPLTGFETYETAVERPFTVQRILQAVEIMGDDLQIGFRNARQDIPFLYNTIQTWIQYWIEIKRDIGYLRTPDLSELELIERLAKHLFSAYAHYHYEKINKTLGVGHSGEMTLLDALRGRMMFGTDMDEGLSFISHVDEYRSLTGQTGGAGMSFGSASGLLQGLGGL